VLIAFLELCLLCISRQSNSQVSSGGDDTFTVIEMFEEADDKLFSHVLANDSHMLQSICLIEQTCSATQGRAHNKTFISNTYTIEL